MAVTAKKIAQIMGLSEAAVSMALNNKPGVSTATRQQVMTVAREQGYDFAGRQRRSAESPPVLQGTISFILYKKHGAVVSDTPFFDQLAEGIYRGAKENHYALQIQYIYENKTEFVEAQIKKLPFCNGFILLATEMRFMDFQPFYAMHIPMVVVDTYYENLKCDCVLINNFQGAYQATNYIIRKTNAQPGYLRSSYPIGNFEERADGFYKSIRDNGLCASQSQVFYLTPSVNGAYHDMLSLLKNGEKPARCFFADNDLIAAGAIQALKEAGYVVPEDVGVIGFDNTPICTHTTPAITSINVPAHYIGKLAVKRLAERLRFGEDYPIKIEVGTNIIRRKSL